MKEPIVPKEYILFQFCREFGILPHEVDDMDDAQYQLFLDFMRAENHASTIQQKRSAQQNNT